MTAALVLTQVLNGLQLGVLLFFNEAVRMIWGASPLYSQTPDWLSGTVELFGFSYAAYRFAIIAVGLAVAGFLAWLINGTRVGMLIRAGATHAPIVAALGVSIRLLNRMTFALGAGLAALASTLIYLLMAAVLAFRPQGLFPVHRS